MSAVSTIGFDTFPKQGNNLGKVAKVHFNYETGRVLKGVVVRDDTEKPFVTLIKLDDGRHVGGAECQYTV